MNFHSLEKCRLTADLIEVLKWYRGDNKWDIKVVFGVNILDITKNNEFKLEKFGCRREMGRNWFSYRVVE